ncbi:reverse transcriptase-like protein, partial [Mycolicibacterium porcinum]|uniref:reverse transcriptase-like protein n=1 Tax=Mycolicibacterium porcinum TaxID=39693 RepID=UPI0034CFBE17
MKVLVEADGGSRGNPGPAGYGAVVLDADHDAVLAERKEAIGRTTNNVAEYRGLIAGLAAATELGATEVAVSMDSKLVVEQMSGRWKVKHPDLIPLQRQAAELAAGFDRVSYSWIPRERNSHADRLANAAMDAAAGILGDAPASAPEPVVAEKPTLSAPGWTGGGRWNPPGGGGGGGPGPVAVPSAGGRLLGAPAARKRGCGGGGGAAAGSWGGRRGRGGRAAHGCATELRSMSAGLPGGGAPVG